MDHRGSCSIYRLENVFKLIDPLHLHLRLVMARKSVTTSLSCRKSAGHSDTNIVFLLALSSLTDECELKEAAPPQSLWSLSARYC